MNKICNREYVTITSRCGFLIAIVMASVTVPAIAEELRIVPTFESAGLYWKSADGALNQPCTVRYRVSPSGKWKQGFPLWYDDRDNQWGKEFRGSLVHLSPGVIYDVEVRAGNTVARNKFQTWPKQFPVGVQHRQTAISNHPLIIRKSGTAKAYAVYEPAGESAIIDVKYQHDRCIRIENASYVIIRGLTLRGAIRNGIELVGDVHDVIIEGCDISGWGRIAQDSWGVQADSAIFSRSSQLTRIVLQHNLIHHPRGDANNWNELRPTPQNPRNYHPGGPQAVLLAESAGNHVIRYNTIYSDDDHQFNDILGAAKNYSRRGFPNCDSDIYGNRLSHCWDDAIESEGANRNVRIWGNYTEKTMVHVATATTSVGPLYIWRNIAGETRRSNTGSPDKIKRGGFLKTSDRLGGGRIYVFHNTLLQPPPTKDARNTRGAQLGMGTGGPMANTVSRNNIFHTSAKGGPFQDRTRDLAGDYDYDLYNGRLLIPTHERHGIEGTPLYQPRPTVGSTSSPYTLSPDSAGVDRGVLIPNFNDDFTGSAPDIGAHEIGSESMQFGVNGEQQLK